MVSLGIQFAAVRHHNPFRIYAPLKADIKAEEKTHAMPLRAFRQHSFGEGFGYFQGHADLFP
jgi:hypothetical protein